LIINSLILNDISAFSSPGPTRDGRIKPEISAPGQMIAASYSSDASPSSQYSMFKSANKQFPSAYISQDNKHALSQGTSFAAPHVSGTIALILELKPNKTMEQIREAIFSSARSDNFTSDQNKWGYGKLATLNALLTVSVKDFLIANQTIKSSQLLQNYPNPFNTETNIVYSIEGNQLVNLAICNQLGQKIKTLVTAQQALGYYKILWDGKNDDGEHVPSGIYFCRLKTETFSKTKKLILLQ
jgi:subtilisin family serine protease